MNAVSLIGNLTKDPEVRYGQTGTAYGRFTVAVERGKGKDGKDMGTDFIPVVCFGSTAENVERYLLKGMKVGVIGRIQTGSYEKDGRKVYTTEVYAERVEFLTRKDNTLDETEKATQVPEGFEKVEDEDIPF